MEYFKTITQEGLIELIKSTKKDLFLCLPSFHKEITNAISQLSFSNSFNENEIAFHLLIDFDSQTFRQGYGDYQCVEDLIKAGYEVKTLEDNRISFIISDDIGYYLFIESRSLIPAEKETINAVKIDLISLVRLKKFFFSSAIDMDFEDELANAIIEESKQLSQANLLSNQIAPVLGLSESKINEVAEDIKRNPPLNPDYKRIVEFYSNKFQYVRLKFEGSNLQYRKIGLPSKILPIADANLKRRLETKLNIFDPLNSHECFLPLQEIKDEVLMIRDKYLTKVKSRDESLLNKMQKVNFESTLNELRKKIHKVQQQSLNHIALQISESKERLIADLTEFFIANPNELIKDNLEFVKNDPKYIVTAAQSTAAKIIHKLHWPEAHSLIREFNLDVQYSDITFEDLKKKKFINELKECGLISEEDENQLAEFNRGILTS